MSQFDDPEGAMPPPDDPDGSGAHGAAGGGAAGGGSVGNGAAGDGAPGNGSAGDGGDGGEGGAGPANGADSFAVECAPVVAAHPGPPVAVPVPDERLDRKVVIYWLLSGLMSWLFITAFLGGGAAFVYVKWPEAATLVVIGVATLLGLLLIWALISPSLAWVRWRFRVDKELLLARYGILFIEEKAIPISRLQHVDLYRGLLERFFGLTTLIVFTAGTEGAHFRLPGLSMHRARELRDLILAARGDDVI